MKGRKVGITLLILATAATSLIAYKTGINPPVGNVAGAFASIAVLVIVSKIIKVSDELFYSGLIFVFMASPLGSVINLYRSFGPYDKIVHLISGFLLAALGMLIMEKLMRNSSRRCDFYIYALPMIFGACMFSSGCAGIWEIFEFLADKIAGGEMQRGMVDTVTDIIAGNIGALFYGGMMLSRRRLG
ncbi:MAG: hypothetical protein UC708_02050 [Anaerovoracaceae bacterium]|nr:hypothetical protein [Bacillota bacterium]MEE0516641.1 hypothetical protein [Anaerovoracaceae bacterium]